MEWPFRIGRSAVVAKAVGEHSPAKLLGRIHGSRRGLRGTRVSPESCVPDCQCCRRPNLLISSEKLIDFASSRYNAEI